MELTVGGRPAIQDPSDYQIVDSLQWLGASSDTFAILSKTEMTYIQTAGTFDDGFVLEYQLGSIDQHFRSESDSLPLETVSEAFLLYAAGDPAWQQVTSWQKEDLGGASTPLWPIVAVVLVAAAVVAYLATRAA